MSLYQVSSKKKKKSPKAKVFIHVCDVTPLFPSSIASLSILYLSYSPFLSPLVLFPLLTNGTRCLASQIVSAPSYPSIHKIESLTHYIPFFFFFFLISGVSLLSALCPNCPPTTVLIKAPLSEKLVPFNFARPQFL